MSIESQEGGPAALWLAYNDAENRRDFKAMSGLVAEQMTATINGKPDIGSAEEDERTMRAMMQVYPDYRREAVEVFESENRVVARWRMLGTPADPARYPVFDVSGCSIVRVENGVMAEADLYCDGELLNRLTAEALTAAGG